MKSIVIAPTAHLEVSLWGDQKMHLVLAHLLKNPVYAEFYRNRRRWGDYLILDNSAHEMGRGQDILGLLKLGERLHAQEIVLPDVLFDASGTIQATSDALMTLVSLGIDAIYQPRWMLVPQGETPIDYSVCLDTLLWKYEIVMQNFPNYFTPPVLGISKDYATTFGQPYFRSIIETVIEYKRTRIPGMSIHLLGWPKPIWDMSDIAREFGDDIRSTDSARVSTFAYHRMLLIPGEDVEYPGRPDDLFSTTFDSLQITALRRNIEVYRAAVDGRG